MKSTEVIKEIMDKQGVSQGVMAKRLNLKSQPVVSMRLQQENISIKTANEMLKVLGYKIVFMPDTQRTPTDSYEVE